MTTISANQLRPGAVVLYHGQAHRVTRIRQNAGWSWPVAYDGTGWAMALSGDVVLAEPLAQASVP